jgi:hypothetical protein
MMLEKYRLQVMETLKACKDPVRARGFLAEVDLALMNGKINAQAQKVFWTALNNDLDVLAQQSTRLSERQAATALGVIVTAQAVISLYQLTLASDERGLASAPRTR